MIFRFTSLAPSKLAGTSFNPGTGTSRENELGGLTQFVSIGLQDVKEVQHREQRPIVLTRSEAVETRQVLT